MEPLQGKIQDVLWRNLVTGECRRGLPAPGELDWVKSLAGDVCSEATWL